MMTANFPLKEETYRIIGAAMEVYNVLGYGFRETVYQEALEREFALRQLSFHAQPEIAIRYKDRLLRHHLVPDFVISGRIIVEIKALDALTNRETEQCLHYLTASKLDIVLLLNFGAPKKLGYTRIVAPHLLVIGTNAP